MEKDEDIKQPIRVAHIIGKWIGGGVEAIVMNYYKNINKSKIQFHFICDEDSTNIPYEEIERLGGKVILIPPYQKVFKYQKLLKKVLKEGDYKIVHSHINVLSVFPLRAAKKAGVPVRIAHSHSTSNNKEWKKNILKNILKLFSKIYATDYFACTEHAGKWLFGNKEFDKGKVYILNNAIDIDKFKFNEEIRENKREELGINEDTILIGHIGRFVEQKNHRFLIDVFSEVHKRNENTKLILVGKGPLEDEIKSKVKSLKLNDDVIFLGQRDDVSELYQAFDMFVFPSLYEGLGMVLIEAQVAGCYCVTSTEVPIITKITDDIKFISLNESINIWKDNILNNKKFKNRINCGNKFVDCIYDIRTESNKLENIYVKISQDVKKVELFGIPACGKSYFAKNKLEDYENANEKMIYSNSRTLRNFKKTINIVSFLFINVKMFSKTIILINDIKFNRNKIKMIAYLISTLNMIEKSKKSPKRTVYEEGVIQVLWGICYNAQYTNIFIDKYLKLYESYIADEVIFIDTDINIVQKRLKERCSKGGSELEHDFKNKDNVLYISEDIKQDIIKKVKDKLIYYKGN